MAIMEFEEETILEENKLEKLRLRRELLVSTSIVNDKLGCMWESVRVVID